MSSSAEDARFANWLLRPPTAEEERLAAQLTPEQRAEVEQWLIPTLAATADKAHRLYPVG